MRSGESRAILGRWIFSGGGGAGGTWRLNHPEEHRARLVGTHARIQTVKPRWPMIRFHVDSGVKQTTARPNNRRQGARCETRDARRKSRHSGRRSGCRMASRGRKNRSKPRTNPDQIEDMISGGIDVLGGLRRLGLYRDESETMAQIDLVNN